MRASVCLSVRVGDAVIRAVRRVIRYRVLGRVGIRKEEEEEEESRNPRPRRMKENVVGDVWMGWMECKLKFVCSGRPFSSLQSYYHVKGIIIHAVSTYLLQMTTHIYICRGSIPSTR